MLPSESAETFARFLGDKGIGADVIALDRIVLAALEFYATVPASSLSSAPEADMLLFQYGVYDWGKGEFFELDIARQFIAAGQLDDDAISQLHCTTMFEPTPELRAIRASSNWCQSRAGLGEFREIILASHAYQASLEAKAVRREVWWEQV